MSVEIYICDLKPEVQEQVLSELNLSSDKDGNYDLFPLFVVEKPELLIMPTTPEGKAKLSKELAKFHAEQALKMVQKLPCPTEQKLELIDAVVEHLRSKQ